MAISLQKGGNVNLSKEAPSMQKMTVGLGWNPRATDESNVMQRRSCYPMATSSSMSRNRWDLGEGELSPSDWSRACAF